jgi:hypothetical protein
VIPPWAETSCFDAVFDGSGGRELWFRDAVIHHRPRQLPSRPM